jgi:hypothetical protein
MGAWHQDRLADWQPTDVSEEHIAYIFRVEKQARQETSMKQVVSRIIIRLDFDPEDGGYMFLRNFGWLSADYTALHARMRNTS